MSTFTLQDLTLPMTAEDAIKAIEQHTPPQPTTKEQWMEYGMNNPLSTNATNEGLLNNITQILHEGKTSGWIPQDAPEPQPTLCESTQTPDLPSIINNICAQLQLLATVIGGQARNTTPPEGANLQDCVEQVLVQAEWFEELVKRQLEALDITAIAKDAVQEVVESEVDAYFENCFDVSNHFDFDDAVHDAVGDRIDDVVSDKIDDAVDSYLSNATISISK